MASQGAGTSRKTVATYRQFSSTQVGTKIHTRVNFVYNLEAIPAHILVLESYYVVQSMKCKLLPISIEISNLVEVSPNRQLTWLSRTFPRDTQRRRSFPCFQLNELLNAKKSHFQFLAAAI